MHVSADESRESQELLQDMRSLGNINGHVQQVGTVKEDCLSCLDEKTLISGMGTGCLLYLYKDIDEELSLNLKNLPKVKAGEEEIIELRLTKPNVDNPKYTLEVNNLSNSSARSLVDSKFFSDGLNIDFKIGQGE